MDQGIKELLDKIYNADFCNNTNNYTIPHDGMCSCCNNDGGIVSLDWPFDFNNTIMELEINKESIMSSMINYEGSSYDISHPVDMLIVAYGSKSEIVDEASKVAMFSDDSNIFRVTKNEGDPTYIVKVGDYFYEMNEQPDTPNGVCITVDDNDLYQEDQIISFEDTPDSIKKAALMIFISDSECRIDNMSCDLFPEKNYSLSMVS